jgi:putative cell wall-binding protein
MVNEFSSPIVAIAAAGENFPDAIPAGSVGALAGAPILLTRRNSIPAATIEALTALSPEAVVMLAGGAVVSARVGAKLGVACPCVMRLWGHDRYGIAAAVSRWRFTDAEAVDALYIVCGAGYLDALWQGPWRRTMVLLCCSSAVTRFQDRRWRRSRDSLQAGS